MKETRETVLASGRVRLIHSPAYIGARGDVFRPYPNMSNLTKAQLLSDAPPFWLKPVKTPGEMTTAERDKYLATQLTRWKHHEGLQAHEVV